MIAIQSGVAPSSITGALQDNRTIALRSAHAILCQVLGVPDAVADAMQPAGPFGNAHDGPANFADLHHRPSTDRSDRDSSRALGDKEVLRSFRLERLVRVLRNFDAGPLVTTCREMSESFTRVLAQAC